ncbi:hypothetical protein KKC45_02495 [Patescibacteria group bacterium]|nr:hypothetical protein [Patescibacteria group bacterium]
MDRKNLLVIKKMIQEQTKKIEAATRLKKLLLKKLKKECPHDEVFETTRKTQPPSKIKTMWFPKRTCTLCGLVENGVSGFEKLANPKCIIKKYFKN